MRSMAFIEMLELVDFALREAAARFPASVTVEGFYRLLGVDSLGRDAASIWVIVADDTLVGESAFQPIANAIQAAIVQSFAETGLELRPYVYFRLKSEHERVVPGVR